MESPFPEDDDRHIRRQNLAVLIFIGVLVLFSIWLVDGYDHFIKMEKCIESKRHNCNPIDLPPH